jgi:putative MATE family efflux protein
MTSTASPAPAGFWADVREALRGSHQDFTVGPVGRAILLLSIPMILEMLMESIFAVTDIFFVSRLGPASIASVGLTESLLIIVYTLAMGLGIGASAMVARRIGEKDAEGASLAAAQALVFAAIGSVVLGALGIAFARPLLVLMGADSAVLESGLGYTRIMLGGEAAIILLFVANAIFRGAGDAAIAMRVLWVANGINILLGPCLIFGLGPFPRLGVTGAAVATTIGRSVGAAIAITRMLRPGARLHVELRHLRPHWDVIGRLAKLSSSATVQMLIGSASWIGLVRIISSYGSTALASYTIGIRVIMFALLPSFGMSNAAATLVGQALGAKKPERAEEAVWRAGFYNLCFLGVVGLLFVLAAPQIVGLFTQDPDVLPLGISCLRIVASGFLFYAYGMVFTQAFNGAGDTRTPTMLNLVVFWLFEIPLAWILSGPAHMGPRGVFTAIPIAFSALAVFSAVLFKRGAWKTKMV